MFGHQSRLKLNSTNLIDALTDLFNLRGKPAVFRLCNAFEFIAKALRDSIEAFWSLDNRHPIGQPPGKRLLREF